ncbi:MAG: VOC family protein [Eubacteriales bacterium]
MINSLSIGDISIDCTYPQRTRDFYAALTGWEKHEAYGCPAIVSENDLLILFRGCDFKYIPPVWPEEDGKQQKQMHLDFTVDNVPSAVEEAVRLGAIKAASQYGGDHCVTMLDPEGHPFCLCKRQNKSEFELWFEQRGYKAIPNPSINIDCPDTKRLREFYAKLTPWDQDFHWTALVAENGMVVHFMQCDFDYIPPVWPEEPGKQQKQMNFNFQVDDMPSAVEEALLLGATKVDVQYDGDHFITMLDPEGHPFCLCRK